MYFLYCLFSYPKKLAFKNHQTDQTWQQPYYVCFDGPLPFLSLGCRFTTRQGSRFRSGDETPASEADSEATSLVCVAEAIRIHPGSGDEIQNSKKMFGKLFGLWWINGSIWIYEKKSTSSCISYDGAKDGKSLTSTPCRRTILLQWHALLKVLAGSVGA